MIARSISPVAAATAAPRSGLRARRPTLWDAWPLLSAAAKSSALAKRSAGTLLSARRITPSSSRVTVERTLRRLGTGSTAWRARIDCAVDPVNGGWPASIS